MDMQTLLRQIQAENTARYTPAEVAALRQRYAEIGELAMQGKIDPRAGAYAGQWEEERENVWRRRGDVQPA